MDQLTAFYELKKLVLLRYQKEYPYVSLDWKAFSSKDILQLIDSIEDATKQRISEKWVYTHLKPAENEKLPRKDMLDILANYSDHSSWDAFVFSLQEPVSVENDLEIQTEPVQPKYRKWWFIPLAGSLIFGVFLFWKYTRTDEKVPTIKEIVQMKDYYTGEEIKDTTIQLFVKENGNLKPLETNNIPEKIMEEQTEIVVESPFYSEAKMEKKTRSIVLKPDDYAMMLKAFIQADLKDWETRKTQLNSILSDDLEALIHLQNNLGIEYMNKEEFAQKLTIPTANIKRWQILSLEQDSLQRITKVRIKQN